jgi:phosphoribosylformylglycinamidine synthase
MVGLLPDAALAGQSGFADEDDYVGFAGWNIMPSLAASELAKLRGEPLPTELPAIDLIHQLKVLKAIREAVRRGELKSCHDVAEGGWLTATAEACLLGGIGCKLDGDGDLDELLAFGEAPCGFVVSGSKENLEKLAAKIPTDIFGQVGGDSLTVGDESWTLAELREAHGALAPLFP